MKILVNNPPPLGGATTVNPAVLVAVDGGVARNVDVDVIFERVTGYTGNISFSAQAFLESDAGETPLNATPTIDIGSANRGTVVLMKASCVLVDGPEPFVRLAAPISSGAPHCISCRRKDGGKSSI